MSKPILCILGSTATGKSKLAIELALRFNGEIISADSMQLYKGLDIVSNKVTKEEQKLVKHHFLDILEPTEIYTVTDFERQVDSVIKELHNQNKLPIIVGGTYYYIESIIYDKLIRTESNSDEKLTLTDSAQNRIDYTDADLSSVENFFKHEIHTFNFDNVDSLKLHNLLRQVDPETANTLHPKDKRKIVRALQVCQKRKTKYSDLIREQHKRGGQAKISGQLKFPNSLILNLDVEKGVLHERIDRRVDAMLERGLLEELTNFHNIYTEITNQKKYSHMNYRKGIFQVIGLKEFDDYFSYITKEELNGRKVIDEKLINNDDIKEKLMRRGLENLRVITKKYSNTQIDWFRNRIAANLNKRPTPPVYSFDTSDLDKWNERVLEPSIEIVDHILLKQQPVDDLPEHLKQYRVEEYKKKQNDKKLRYCEYCDKSIVDDIVWQLHLNSKKHRLNYNRWLADEREQNKFINRIDLKLIFKLGFGFAIVSLLISSLTNK